MTVVLYLLAEAFDLLSEFNWLTTGSKLIILTNSTGRGSDVTNCLSTSYAYSLAGGFAREAELQAVKSFLCGVE